MCLLDKFQTFLVLKEAKDIVYVTTHGPICTHTEVQYSGLKLRYSVSIVI
jgi:hypothetical protein